MAITLLEFANILTKLSDTLVENDADGAVNDPDIIADVNSFRISNRVVLELNDELGAVNDPDIEDVIA